MLKKKKKKHHLGPRKENTFVSSVSEMTSTELKKGRRRRLGGANEISNRVKNKRTTRKKKKRWRRNTESQVNFEATRSCALYTTAKCVGTANAEISGWKNKKRLRRKNKAAACTVSLHKPTHICDRWRCTPSSGHRCFFFSAAVNQTARGALAGHTWSE